MLQVFQFFSLHKKTVRSGNTDQVNVCKEKQKTPTKLSQILVFFLIAELEQNWKLG